MADITRSMEILSSDSAEFKLALKILIKYEIHCLLQRLSVTGEEAIVITTSISDGVHGHLATTKGEGFLEQADRIQQLKEQFHRFCAGSDDDFDEAVVIKKELPDDYDDDDHSPHPANDTDGPPAKRKRTNSSSKSTKDINQSQSTGGKQNIQTSSTSDKGHKETNHDSSEQLQKLLQKWAKDKEDDGSKTKFQREPRLTGRRSRAGRTGLPTLTAAYNDDDDDVDDTTMEDQDYSDERSDLPLSDDLVKNTTASGGPDHLPQLPSNHTQLPSNHYKQTESDNIPLDFSWKVEKLKRFDLGKKSDIEASKSPNHSCATSCLKTCETENQSTIDIQANKSDAETKSLPIIRIDPNPDDILVKSVDNVYKEVNFTNCDLAMSPYEMHEISERLKLKENQVYGNVSSKHLHQTVLKDLYTSKHSPSRTYHYTNYCEDASPVYTDSEDISETCAGPENNSFGPNNSNAKNVHTESYRLLRNELNKTQEHMEVRMDRKLTNPAVSPELSPLAYTKKNLSELSNEDNLKHRLYSEMFVPGERKSLSPLMYYDEAIDLKTKVKVEPVETSIKTEPFLNQETVSNDQATVSGELQSETGGLITLNFSCKICGQIFKNRQYRDFHVKLHESSHKFLCSLCKTGFDTEEECASHQSEHTEQIFQCDNCGYRCTREFRMRAHKEICGSPTKIHICPYCGKQFAAQRYMRIHMKSHDTKNIHTCPYCQNTYPLKNSLLKHIKKKHTCMQHAYK